MSNALAYFISLGMIGMGVIWIVVSASSANSVFWIVIGVLTIVVGLASFLTELRNGAR